MRTRSRQERELVRRRESRAARSARETRVAAEHQRADADAGRRAARQIRREQHPTGRQRGERLAVLASHGRVELGFIDDVRAEARRQRRHDAAAGVVRRASHLRQREWLNATGVLAAPAPVAAQRERVRVTHDVIDAHER